MTKQQFISFIWLLLCQLIVGGSAVTVYGHVGQSVTLPCKYDGKYYGSLSICWGKGPLPARGCGDQVIQTDGLRVTERLSSRYQLSNRYTNMGDVSLTILRATEQDSGTYGCRVDIPGWFNDQKTHVDLRIQAALTTTTKAPTTTTEALTTTTEALTTTTEALTTTTEATTIETTVATNTKIELTTTTSTATTETAQITFQETTAELSTTNTWETATRLTAGQPEHAEHLSSKAAQVAELSTTEPSRIQTEQPESTAEGASGGDTTISVTSHEAYTVSAPGSKESVKEPERESIFWWIVPVLGVFVIVSAITILVVKRKQMKMGTFTILEKSVNETLSTMSNSSQGPPSSEISMEVMDSSSYHSMTQ